MATVPIATSAVLIKKIGGYYNTKTHGFLLFLTLTFVVGGLYVIYTNKEMHQKNHLVSWHSWIGVTAAGLLIGEACGGFLALDPDCKIRTSPSVEANIRIIHRYCGKITLILAYIACVTGWYKMSHRMVEASAFGLNAIHVTALFTLPLSVFAYIAFIKKY
mmetsp:Transcript_12685/g.12509  ORF Transcript_12685/g.12509 Transcript_12685/m.12509 type:complete len:161 (-) Transcript_12685:36-518(-)